MSAVDDGHESDRSLVRRFQRGDTGAFERFVRRHQDRLYRIVRVQLESPQEAEDVVQEVFMRAYTGLSAFRFRAEPFTWLFRTARNVVHESNRRGVVPRTRQWTGPELDLDAMPSGGSLETHVDAVRALERLSGLLEDLAPRQREAVILRVLEGLSTEETATALGCRPGTVMALLSVIPGIGAPLIWVPAALWLLVEGQTGAAIGLTVWCAAVVGSVDNLLRPRLVGGDTQMPDLLILLSTLGGIVLFGPVGFSLGPIVAAVFVTMWQLYGRAFSGLLPPTERGTGVVS